MAMEPEDGIALIIKAREKERDERIFQQWVAQLPIMAMEGNAVSYDDYRDRVTGANLDLRPASEIMAELDEVEREFQEGGKENGA